MSNSIQPVTTNNQSINQQTTSTSTVDNSALDQTCQFRDNPTFHLIAWIDPIATGKLFLSIIGTLIILKHGNPLNWLLHLAYWGLIGTAIAEYAGKVVAGEGFVSKYFPAPTESYAKKFNKNFLPAVENFNVHLENHVKAVVYGNNLEATLKAAGITYILYKLTSWFSVFTLLISAVVFVFTFPALYSRNKSTVDNAIREKTACLRQRVGTLTRDAQKNVQPVINTLIEKSGPVGEFVKKNLNNTRTAGSTVGDSKATSFNTDADRATSGATTGASTTSTSANSRTLHPGVKTATVPVVVPVSIPVKVTTNPFPNVPTSNLNRNDVDQIAHDLRNDTRN